MIYFFADPSYAVGQLTYLQERSGSYSKYLDQVIEWAVVYLQDTPRINLCCVYEARYLQRAEYVGDLTALYEVTEKVCSVRLFPEERMEFILNNG